MKTLKNIIFYPVVACRPSIQDLLGQNIIVSVVLLLLYDLFLSPLTDINCQVSSLYFVQIDKHCIFIIIIIY